MQSVHNKIWYFAEWVEEVDWVTRKTNKNIYCRAKCNNFLCLWFCKSSSQQCPLTQRQLKSQFMANHMRDNCGHVWVELSLVCYIFVLSVLDFYLLRCCWFCRCSMTVVHMLYIHLHGSFLRAFVLPSYDLVSLCLFFRILFRQKQQHCLQLFNAFRNVSIAQCLRFGTSLDSTVRRRQWSDLWGKSYAHLNRVKTKVIITIRHSPACIDYNSSAHIFKLITVTGCSQRDLHSHVSLTQF